MVFPKTREKFEVYEMRVMEYNVRLIVRNEGKLSIFLNSHIPALTARVAWAAVRAITRAERLG